MKAAVCHAFGEDLVIEEVTLRAPGPGEVEIRMSACAICHSDITYAKGDWGGFLPAVYGHEGAGYVAALGDGVQGLLVGDPVLVTLIRSCGECPNCATGQPARCETGVDRVKGPLTTADGGPLEQGMQTAAFAERVVVDQSQVVKIPADMPMASASLLSCGVITGVGAAINTGRIRPGSSVAVIGAGGVGLNVIQGAAIAGAARIIAVDLEPSKLTAALEFGATDKVLASDTAVDELRTLTGGRGVDTVLVAVGSAAVYQTAPDYLCQGGTLVMVGMPPVGAGVTWEPLNIASLSHSMLGSCMGDTVLARDIPYLVSLYQQGRLKLDQLVSKTWAFEDINLAIADTLAGKARRNVILFDDTGTP